MSQKSYWITVVVALGTWAWVQTVAHASGEISEPAAQPASLEDQLQGLSLPDNQSPAAVSTEKLYSVQTRHNPLASRSEFSLGAGKNLGSDGFLDSSQVSLTYRYHLNDRWFIQAGAAMVSNSMSGSARAFYDRDRILPDAAYVKQRADLVLGRNLFYGKFRVSAEKVLYFDQYISVGPGYAILNTGSTPAAVADIGFVFWLGQQASLRIGAQDYYFKEKRQLKTGMTNQIIGHIDLGILLGDGV